MGLCTKMCGGFRPERLLYVSVLLLGSLISSCSSLPVPEPDIKETLDLEKIHVIEHDGKTYEISTRDIILISAAAILALFIIVCCIGYCFCECVKSLICCICCCDC